MNVVRRFRIVLAVPLVLLLAVAGCGREAATPGSGAAPAGADAGAGSIAAGSTGDAGLGTGAAGSTAGAADGAAHAEAVRARAESLPKVEGRWQHGDADSAYVARFENGELRYLEERIDGPGGSRENRYFFEGGELYYFDGEQPAGAASGGGPAATAARVPVVAEFRGTEVVRGVSREHHGEKKLPPATLDGIRRQAQALAGAAQDEWSAQQVR